MNLLSIEQWMCLQSVPKWANWVAVDKNGKVYVYNLEPFHDKGTIPSIWIGLGNAIKVKYLGKVRMEGKNWKVMKGRI